jgi:hypothetical protein
MLRLGLLQRSSVTSKVCFASTDDPLFSSMTRYTNFGRKRTYVASGLNYRDSTAPEPEPELEPKQSSPTPVESDIAQADPAMPPKKKRKRSKKGKEKVGEGEAVVTEGEKDGAAKKEGANEVDEAEGEVDGTEGAGEPEPVVRGKTKKEKLKEKHKAKWKKGVFSACRTQATTLDALRAQMRRTAQRRRRNGD